MLGKWGHTWKNGCTLLQVCNNWRKRSHLENESHLEKCVPLGKVAHTFKNRSHVEKWVTLGKHGHTLKNGLQLEQWNKLGKMGRT